MNGKRNKDGTLKRQIEWVAPRRGKMICSSCGIPRYNARGCHKLKKIVKKSCLKLDRLRMDKQCDKGKKKERHKTLIDEEDVEHSSTRSPNAATMEDFPLTALQPSQDCYHMNILKILVLKMRMPYPRIQETQAQPIESTKINFVGDGLIVPERHRTLVDKEDVEDFLLTAPQPTQDCTSDEYFGLEKQAQPTWSRKINFLGDGLTAPRGLYAPKRITWKVNASITERMLEQLRVVKI
ncbi:hypothetical protein H5410_027906 [Solanum commersonii]|uniref:Uncharacterized protein n=1 Tax=Solanum commersonii TaxID=4109 RepID=A0A9J5Z5W5_SOLCO|nr:hypothetical protein H5410_027906 [Solanum commersonii]